MGILQLQIEEWKEVGNSKDYYISFNRRNSQHTVEMIINLKSRFEEKLKQLGMFALYE